MLCCHRSRAWHLFIISFWLLITVIRQTFDSIGRLWIPIVFNSFQIIFCISGLISVVYYHKRLLVAFTLLNFTSILYNIVLILWYNQLFTVSQDIPILSAGSSHSHSFFLRYTPSCESHYSLANYRWIQLPCFIPYYHVESAQALLHIIMANLSILLSIPLFSKQNFKPKKFEEQSANTNSNTGGYNQGYSNGKINLTNGVINERCMKPENGYQRYSTKKPGRKCYRETSTVQNSSYFRQPFPLQHLHSMTDSTNECDEIGRHIHCQQHSQPVNGVSNIIYLSKRSQIPGTKGKIVATAESVNRYGSLKNFKMPTTEGVRRILSHEQVPINLVDNFPPNNICANLPNNNLKSLVSFDPKSNILLRIHNHIDDDNDDFDNKNDNSTYLVDAVQQQQRQQQRISKQISSVSGLEQIQYRNSKHPTPNNFLTTHQPSKMTFNLSATDNSGYCGVNSFGRSCNTRLPNSLRQQQQLFGNQNMTLI